MSGNVTKSLAEFVANTQYSDLPAEVVAESKRMILDATGCMLGGGPTEIGTIAIDFVKKLGGKRQSTIVGVAGRVPCVNAVYANGRMGNALDYDDTFPTPAHIGNPTVASALPICEMLKTHGEKLITSVAVGYELAARTSMAIRMPFRTDKGKTSTVRRRPGNTKDFVFAAAGAAAKALEQDADTVAQTFSIAGGSCPISVYPKFDEVANIPLFKYADVGWCSQIGATAALFASDGYTSYESIFDGDTGFGFLYGADYVENSLLADGLGQKWHLTENAYKLWPACHATCYVLTAFEKLLAHHKLGAEEVEKVRVLVHAGMTKPRFTNQDPASMVGAEFSIPHTLAMIILGVPRGPLWHAPKTRSDPAVARFRRKVRVELDPESEAVSGPSGVGPRRRVRISVEATTNRGEKFLSVTEHVKGEGSGAPPEYYAKNQDLEAKFRELASFSGLSKEPAKVDKSINLIWNLEKLKDVSQLARVLSPTSSV